MPDLPRGPRTRVTIDAEGNVWSYAPTQPGGVIKLGRVGGAEAEAEGSTKELDDLKKENQRLKDRLHAAQDKIKDLEEEDKKPSRRK